MIEKNKNLKLGFTLLELLVVVIIIGILAAIALPQYKKSVTKSKFSTLKFLTKAIVRSQEVNYLTHGEYATKFEDLDIDMPTPNEITNEGSRYVYDWGRCDLTDYHIICRNSKINMQLDLYYTYAHTTPGLQVCVITGTNDLNEYRNHICKEETKENRSYVYGKNIFWYYN